MCGIYKKIIDKIKAGDPTWKDDFTENLNCLNPTQIIAIEILSSTPATAELIEIIPSDCEGNPTGEETKATASVVLNNVLSTLCNVDELADAIGDRLAEETQKIVDAINETSQNESELLTEISGKLDELEAIKEELVSVNTTLVDIQTEVEGIHTDTTAIKDKTTEIATNTAATNVKLEDIKTKLDTQISHLEDLKTLVETSNTKLDTIEATLEVISTDIAVIKNDISAIKTDIADIEVLLGDIKVILEGIATDVSAILVAVESIDTKLDTVTASLESIEDKLDTVITELQGIKSVLDAIKAELNVSLVYSSSEMICANDGGVKTQAYVRTKSLWDNEAGISLSDTAQFSLDGSTWTSTAPAGTITVGACVADAIPDETLVDFQPVDCAGAPVGASVKVNQTTVLNKVLANLCNTADIVDPIVDAIQEQGTSLKKQDFISWVAAVGNTLTIPVSKFSTISMMATKGEFKIQNTANDFIPDLTASAGTLSDFIEISEDGIGTATGSTLTPQGYDTRANSLDMAPDLNSFLVTCVRAGVLKLELYRD
jgi:predicted  nucleic acid-binding Zn-ribbon protein